MVPEDAMGDVAGAALHKPDTSWVALGRVVYSWTDRRDSTADRAWRAIQRACHYPFMAAVRNTEGLRGGNGSEPATA